MHPVTDLDALLLLATALGSKRRPAELADIVAAADLLQSTIPAATKFAEAVERLARHGLLVERDGGLALTPAAQQMVADQPRKAEVAERLFGIRQQLAAHPSKGEEAPVLIAATQIEASIAAHRAAAQSGAKNLLVPKPKPEGEQKRPGQRRRKPLPARRRKD
ncbi:MAG: hypothetical protein KA603_07730 [Azonexus sp.]|nr:hypothetical protein [Betaproteobacteria bacterium]MBK8917457.1 hypothetical protein [Betaproteobacteria bacterium]MBP6036006.1 hypothetical protein [Azonexus sp.]MBP6906528.1 hypothetical protein [Azonexus sp.]